MALLHFNLLCPEPPKVGGASVSRLGTTVDRVYPNARAQSNTIGSKVGRQAEMMPAAISMAVHPTVGANEYVGSELVYVKRTLVRYADAKTTLASWMYG